MEEITRHTGLNDGLRRYNVGGVYVLSVTTIIGEFLEEDGTGLKIWKRRNDGSGNKADHEHLLWYKTYRGTLCHYSALSIFEEEHSGPGMWGDGEREALNELMNGPEDGTFDDASHSNKDVLYSVLKDHGWVHSRDEFAHRFETRYCSRCDAKKNTSDKNCPTCGAFMRHETTQSIMDVQKADADWFVSEFEVLCDTLGVTEESVIAVEHFLINLEHGYGGQCDIVYEDPEGNIVIADLKTSSGLRLKHRLQAVAYKHAVEDADDVPVDNIDRMEVWLIHPDSHTSTVHADHVPEHAEDYDWYTDDEWLVDPWGKFEYESVEEQWQHFKKLVDQAN